MMALFIYQQYKKISPGRFLLLILVAPLVFIVPIYAQFYNGYQMEFGRSRIQYSDRFWTFYKFDRFDVYFYLNGKELAEYTARHALIELPRIEVELGTYLPGKIQFIIFNNLNDLKHSNIGFSADLHYNPGGVSYILGNKVILYFDGSITNFEKQIRQGIIHVLLQNSIFGSSIGSQMMNSMLQNLPDWFTRGLISYLAEEWNTEIDNRMRNAFLSGKYRNFHRFVSDEQLTTDAGHSFWKYIADQYGRENVMNIVNMTRASKNPENGFQYILGKSTRKLYKDWYTHYLQRYLDEQSGRDPLPENQMITGKRGLKRNHPGRVYSQLKVAPDGKHLAFATNEGGKYRIWLLDNQSGRIRRIFTGGYRLEEKVDYSYPVLAWHPSSVILSMLIEDKGVHQLHFYDLNERKWNSRNLFGFEKILDFSYAPNGQLIVFSGVQNGQSDIFTFNLISGSYERITNDIFDDFYPRFIEGTSRIVFSSNRISDTLPSETRTFLNGQMTNYDIFVYDYASRSSILRRITSTPSADEKSPIIYHKNYLTYLSDESGIYNIYLSRPDSVVAFVDTAVHYRYFSHNYPISNYPRNIREIDIAPRAATQVMISNVDRLDRLYQSDRVLPEYLQPANPPPTNFAKTRTIQFPALPSLRITQLRSRSEPIPPSSGVAPTTSRKSFRNVMRSEKELSPSSISDTSRISNILESIPRNDLQGFLEINMPDTANAMISRFQPKRITTDDLLENFQLPVQRNYNTEYSINQLVTQVDFSYLNQSYQPFSSIGRPFFINPGLSPTFKVGLTDLLEDYRIIGGVRLGLDLVNKEFFINYANLKKRLDEEILLQYRYLEEAVTSAVLLRQKTYEAFYILTYPFNRVFRWRNTFLIRNENYIITGPFEQLLREPDVAWNWGGVKTQFIFDDTRELGLNLPLGTRFMIFGEYNQKIQSGGNNLIVLGFDFRDYRRIHRQFIWANRIAGSTNFGNERLIYFMGGTDGWMAPRFDRTTRIDPDQNWTYQTLATNMRGFYQNARNGNNFLVLNSELRFPVFTYLFNRPIQSEFLRNFQLVTFADAGTAWAGWNPFDENNVLFTKYESFGMLRIKVQYEKDPLIAGIGAGARTKLLGYFLKGDIAWGIEDGRIKRKPVFYLSMSLDF